MTDMSEDLIERLKKELDELEASLRVAVEALKDAKLALDDLVMTYMDGENEGEHGGDHDDADCPTCRAVVRAQDGYRKTADALATLTPLGVEGGGIGKGSSVAESGGTASPKSDSSEGPR